MKVTQGEDMYNKKKSSGTSKISSPTKKNPSRIDDIHKKITSSSALNGGFDTLLFKIDKIEQGQGQLANKVDKIHDAIYDPKEGLFSQIASQKHENAINLSQINASISEVNTWKKGFEADLQEEVKRSDSTDENVGKMKVTVDQLVQSKSTVKSFLKWFLVAVGGGGITLLFKWLESSIK